MQTKNKKKKTINKENKLKTNKSINFQKLVIVITGLVFYFP